MQRAMRLTYGLLYVNKPVKSLPVSSVDAAQPRASNIGQG